MHKALPLSEFFALRACRGVGKVNLASVMISLRRGKLARWPRRSSKLMLLLAFYNIK